MMTVNEVIEYLDIPLTGVNQAMRDGRLTPAGYPAAKFSPDEVELLKQDTEYLETLRMRGV